MYLSRAEALFHWKEVENLRKINTHTHTHTGTHTHGEGEEGEKVGGFDKGLVLGREDGCVKGVADALQWLLVGGKYAHIDTHIHTHKEKEKGKRVLRFWLKDEKGVKHAVEVEEEREGVKELVEAWGGKKVCIFTRVCVCMYVCM